jgi:hypothetical protein
MTTHTQKVEFTPQQLKDWKAFERVRKSGRYNMYDPRARRATKLSSGRYSFVMQFFTELKSAVESAKAQGTP